MVDMNIKSEILKDVPEPNYTLVRECIICGNSTTDIQHLICMECRKRLMKILYPERKK
jgi:hypothetical protein